MDETSFQWAGSDTKRAGAWKATVYLCKGTKELGLLVQAKTSHFVATSVVARKALEKRFQRLGMEAKQHARRWGHEHTGRRAKKTIEKSVASGGAVDRAPKWKALRRGSVSGVSEVAVVTLRSLAGIVAGHPQQGRSLTRCLATQQQELMDPIFDATADL
ncbi:unnamed protein product, partial [Prorocentrum cordatum]